MAAYIELISFIFQPKAYIIFCIIIQAVKLDIDHAELEMAILGEIHADKDAINMISELFFEMHYDSVAMARWFKHPNQTYLGTLEYITSLRNDGVRLHYWP